MSLEVTVRGITIPAEELAWRFSRSQGPGGQSVNTTDSQAELSYDLARSAALPPTAEGTRDVSPGRAAFRRRDHSRG